MGYTRLSAVYVTSSELPSGWQNLSIKRYNWFYCGQCIWIKPNGKGRDVS